MVGPYDSGWGGRESPHPVKEINDLRAQLAKAMHLLDIANGHLSQSAPISYNAKIEWLGGYKALVELKPETK
jgi:hypothetical protein